MMRTTRNVIVALIAITLTLPAASAFAATSPWQSVDVTLHTDQEQPMLIISGELPPNAKLPQEAELAVPAGMELQWIGEILGGATSEDPELQFVKSTESGMDIYRFTLTKSRTAQAEVVALGLNSNDGTQYSTALKWTALQAIPEVRISQQLFDGAQISQTATGAAMQPGETGFVYYTKTVKNSKAGDVLDLTFSYTEPPGSAQSTSIAVAGAAAGPDSQVLALTVLFIVAVGGLGFVAYKVNGKMRAQ